MKTLLPSILAGVLFGCALPAGAPYWVPRDKPVPVVSETIVADVTLFCGARSMNYRRGGCFVEIFGHGFIYLQEPGALRPDIRITAEEFECARKHERKHSTHIHDAREVRSWDCGS